MPDEFVAQYNARLKESQERRRRYEARVDAYHSSLAMLDHERPTNQLTILEPTEILPPSKSSPSVQYFYTWLKRNAAVFTRRAS